MLKILSGRVRKTFAVAWVNDEYEDDDDDDDVFSWSVVELLFHPVFQIFGVCAWFHFVKGIKYFVIQMVYSNVTEYATGVRVKGLKKRMTDECVTWEREKERESRVESSGTLVCVWHMVNS